jgi:Tol biopolymer transport system component
MRSFRLGRLVYTLATLALFLNETTRADDSTARIAVMDADGGNARELTHIDSHTKHGLPRWSPDGSKIVFDVSYKKTGEYDPRLFVVDAKGGEPIDVGLGKMPSWSPDGTQIVFRMPPAADPRGGVWIMNSNGEGREFLFPGNQPMFSPDASRISYTSEDLSDLYIYDVLEGTHRKLNEPYASIIGHAAWSPDGKQLCFIGKKDSGEKELAVIAADDKQAQPKVCWTKGALARNPNWTPDGNILLTLRASGGSQIYVFDPNKDSKLQLFEPQPTGFNFDANYSPDRKRIVFATDAALEKAR